MYSPAPKSPELSEKSKKYDRQIRLWGDHGQALLENANVCLINVTGLGAEILKGLVLPGIGGFTIVDGAVVTEEDVGCNFFQESSNIGLSRAKCCMQLLQELNPDVSSDYVDQSIESLLETNPEFFKAFNIVVAAASMREKTVIVLSNILWDLNIPFFLCHSIGFLGIARLQIKEHCIIETHPDNKQYDLRIQQPFTTLKEHLDNSELNHKVPWLVVLYKYLEKWRKENDGKIPSNYKEKSQLRSMIRLGMTKDEENYEEAIRAVNSVFGGGKPNANLQDLFTDDACINLNIKSKVFWILLRALKDFIDNDGAGMLPVPGVIPDMTADTTNYLQLQNIYRAQAQHDADIVYRLAQEHLNALNLPSETITDRDVKLFCREAATVCIHRGTQLADDYETIVSNSQNSPSTRTQYIAQQLEMPNSLTNHWLMLRVLNRFHTEYGCMPGECSQEIDLARMKSIGVKLLNEWGLHTAQFSDDLAHELCRYGGAEIHSVSAFLGGCVAHEIIKLITKQYKPMNNTFLYNAITSETATFQL